MTCPWRNKRGGKNCTVENVSILNWDIKSVSSQIARGPMNWVAWNNSVQATAKPQSSLKPSLPPQREVQGTVLVFLRRCRCAKIYSCAHRGFRAENERLCISPVFSCCLCDAAKLPASSSSSPSRNPAKITHYQQPRNLGCLQCFLPL